MITVIRKSIISSISLTFALAACGCDDGALEHDSNLELASEDELAFEDELELEDAQHDGNDDADAIDELEAEIEPEHAELGVSLYGTMRGRCVDGSIRAGTWGFDVPPGVSELSGVTFDDLGNEGTLTGSVLQDTIRVQEHSELGMCRWIGRVDMTTWRASGTWRCTRCAGKWVSLGQVAI